MYAADDLLHPLSSYVTGQEVLRGGKAPSNKTGNPHSHRQRYSRVLNGGARSGLPVSGKNHPRFAPVFFRKTLPRLDPAFSGL
ncbi:hypothetical protein [Dysgonomonas termitidis]|jgi:hypothetical protein|uniref:Uncharacterized protein n=1 Tax=Dysgonomonas termitidis TaxID=1516126 RepID=A0ABV9KWS1_9BACT